MFVLTYRCWPKRSHYHVIIALDPCADHVFTFARLVNVADVIDFCGIFRSLPQGYKTVVFLDEKPLTTALCDNIFSKKPYELVWFAKWAADHAE